MIDLHIHTNHSDGTYSVKELLEKAEDRKLEIISITDHDSIGAYKEIEDNKDLRALYSGEIIVGAELKTYYKGVSIEVLAYGMDYNKIRINKIDAEELQNKHLNKFKKIMDELGLKYNSKDLYIDINDPMRQYAGNIVGRELVKYPENQDIIKRIGEFIPETFFRVHQTNRNSVFYIDESEDLIDLNETISRIHEAGGLAFLAHGYIYPFKNKDEIIEEILSTTDIDGIECEYPLFSYEERAKAKRLADKYNKFKSGGTDYHAKNKPTIALGTGEKNNINISKDFIDGWVDKVRKI